MRRERRRRGHTRGSRAIPVISVPPLVSQARGRTLVSIDSIDSKDETRLLPLNIIINPFTTRTTRTCSPALDRRTVASSRRRTRPRRPHPPNHARTRRFLRAASLTRLSARAPAPRLNLILPLRAMTGRPAEQRPEPRTAAGRRTVAVDVLVEPDRSIPRVPERTGRHIVERIFPVAAVV